MNNVKTVLVVGLIGLVFSLAVYGTGYYVGYAKAVDAGKQRLVEITKQYDERVAAYSDAAEQYRTTLERYKAGIARISEKLEEGRTSGREVREGLRGRIVDVERIIQRFSILAESIQQLRDLASGGAGFSGLFDNSAFNDVGTNRDGQ